MSALNDAGGNFGGGLHKRNVTEINPNNNNMINSVAANDTNQATATAGSTISTA